MNVSNTYEKATNELLETELFCAFEKIWEDLEYDEKKVALKNEKIDLRFYGTEEIDLDLFFQDSSIKKKFEFLTNYGLRCNIDDVADSLLEAVGYKVLSRRKVGFRLDDWQDDRQLTSFEVMATGAGKDWDTEDCINDLPVSLFYLRRLRVGDMLVLPTCDEIVPIKSINLQKQTIGLHTRGFGSSSPYAQGVAPFLIRIFGHLTKEELRRAMRPIKFNN